VGEDVSAVRARGEVDSECGRGSEHGNVSGEVNARWIPGGDSRDHGFGSRKVDEDEGTPEHRMVSGTRAWIWPPQGGRRSERWPSIAR